MHHLFRGMDAPVSVRVKDRTYSNILTLNFRLLC